MQMEGQMPEPTTQTETPAESLGWRAGLTGDLQQNEVFKTFKGVSDLATDYLDKSTKYTELEGKLKDYVPKLPDNATDADKALYFDALGRPKQASEYKIEGEDSNAAEWNQWARGLMHQNGLTQKQVEGIVPAFNRQIQAMVDAANNKVKSENAAAEQKLRSEMGDKFDTNVELAKRMTKNHLGAEFDTVFASLNGDARFGVMRILLKLASLTGEDKSPQSVQRPTANGVDNPYPKSNMPPKRATSFAPAG
jgi:hypothetical protein